MNAEFFQENISSHFINQVKDYAIFAMDTDGLVASWNEGAERMKGYKEEEIVGQYFGILFLEEDQQKGEPQKELEGAKKEGHFEHQGWRRKKDGSMFFAEVVLTAIYNEEKKLIGFTKVTKDVTEKKRQEDDLSHKNEELTKTNKDLDTFIYTASHDLKTPILNIDGLLQRLVQMHENKGIQDAELQTIFSLMQTSVDRFKTTLQDLTTISRLQRSIKEESNEEKVDIGATYEDILSDVSFLFEQFKFPCQVETDFKVTRLSFSRKNFRSILYNLLSNAIKYRSPNYACQIRVQTFRESGRVVLVVKDNGLGMSKRNQQQLFTMFKRFHDHVEGSGIGLYIVKRMVDNAGGSIEIISKEGEGTECRVYFKG